MTEPAKAGGAPDAHAKKPEDAHAKKPDKKPLGSKIWGWVGATIVISVGLIVLFTLGGPLFTQSLDAFNSALQSVFTAGVSAISNFGTGASNFLKATSTSLSRILMALVQLVILPIILFFIGKKIWELIKKSSAGGNAH